MQFFSFSSIEGVTGSNLFYYCKLHVVFTVSWQIKMLACGFGWHVHCGSRHISIWRRPSAYTTDCPSRSRSIYAASCQPAPRAGVCLPPPWSLHRHFGPQLPSLGPEAASVARQPPEVQHLRIRLLAALVIEHWRDKMLLPSHTVDLATTSTPYSDATQVREIW